MRTNARCSSTTGRSPPSVPCLERLHGEPLLWLVLPMPHPLGDGDVGHLTQLGTTPDEPVARIEHAMEPGGVRCVVMEPVPTLSEFEEGQQHQPPRDVRLVRRRLGLMAVVVDDVAAIQVQGRLDTGEDPREPQQHDGCNDAADGEDERCRNDAVQHDVQEHSPDHTAVLLTPPLDAGQPVKRRPNFRMLIGQLQELLRVLVVELACRTVRAEAVVPKVPRPRSHEWLHTDPLHERVGRVAVAFCVGQHMVRGMVLDPFMVLGEPGTGEPQEQANQPRTDPADGSVSQVAVQEHRHRHGFGQDPRSKRYADQGHRQPD